MFHASEKGKNLTRCKSDEVKPYTKGFYRTCADEDKKSSAASETFVECVTKRQKCCACMQSIQLTRNTQKAEDKIMVDTRSAGAFGIGGALNFKSGDISGTAAKTSDDRAGRGTEYFRSKKGRKEEDNDSFGSGKYMDRSAQLNATLNSLALMNVAGIIKNSKALSKHH